MQSSLPDFTDDFFLTSIRQWLKEGKISHNTSHVKDIKVSQIPKEELELGRKLAQELNQNKAIMGVFNFATAC
jgi:hypothetical protein